jgi:hypothetical protein
MKVMNRVIDEVSAAYGAGKMRENLAHMAVQHLILVSLRVSHPVEYWHPQLQGTPVDLQDRGEYYFNCRENFGGGAMTTLNKTISFKSSRLSSCKKPDTPWA